MFTPLWMTIEPTGSDIRLMLSEPSLGTRLKARLPSPPHDPRALGRLLESLSAWFHRPLHAVLDADAQDVRLQPERWSLLAGDVDGIEVRVQWVSAARETRRRDRFLASMGDFDSSRRLLTFGATGQR